MEKINFSDVAGCVTVGTAIFQKIPQISKVILTKSSNGISMVELYLEKMFFATTILYFYGHRYPLSTYGNAPVLYIANVILLSLIFKVSKQVNKKSVLILVVLMAIFVICFIGLIPMHIVTIIFKSQIFLIIGCRVPQIYAIYANVCMYRNYIYICRNQNKKNQIRMVLDRPHY